ncbi:MAG: endonuclease/exonuclease/phosphatase family protein [Clostridia bacterium]|nr:endonuclease/exonuclease/phosphatase family protein [Clostridia bacterium]
MQIQIVTYNLRMDNPGDGEQRFTYRTDFIKRKILSEKPDVIGFQEVLPHMRRWLIENLEGYTVVGYGRGPVYDDESNCIAYRTDKFELFGLHQFWLSPTPYTPGSRYEIQSQCPRICTIAMLCPIGSATPFRVYNTHLDHISDEARVKGLEFILARITEDNTAFRCPYLLTGDFNALPHHTPIRAALEYSDFPMEDITAEITGSFHGYGTVDRDNKIDYIFTDAGTPFEDVRLWDDRDGILYLSDHYPISAKVTLFE